MFKIEKDGTIVVGGHHFDSPSDLARETAFRIYYTGDRQQEMILSSLVETRHQLATLCGYQTFGHRAVSSSLAQSPENINMFLSSLAVQMEPRLKAEYLTMTSMKEKSCTSGRPLAVWDLVNLKFFFCSFLYTLLSFPALPLLYCEAQLVQHGSGGRLRVLFPGNSHGGRLLRL